MKRRSLISILCALVLGVGCAAPSVFEGAEAEVAAKGAALTADGGVSESNQVIDTQRPGDDGSTSRSACPGETVLIAPEAAPDDQVEIDGQPGHSRWVQVYGVPGGTAVYPVNIKRAGGEVQSERVTIAVREDCAITYPRLRALQNPTDPRRVEFVVENPQDFPKNQKFRYEFGDGTSVTGTAAESHRYAVEAIDWLESHTSFDVRVQAVGRAAAEATKTIAIQPEYAANKARGWIAPPVEYAAKVDGNLRTDLSVKVHNVDDEAIVIDRAVREYRRCDPTVADNPDAPLVRNGPHVDLQPMEIAAGGTGSLSAAISASPTDCDMVLSITGHGVKSGKPVRIRTYTELGERKERVRRVSDPAVVNLLRRMHEQGKFGPDDELSMTDISREEWRRNITEAEADLLRENRAQPIVLFAGAPGSTCDPDNPGQPPRDGFSCQPVDFEASEGYIANAEMGDVLLSRGCGAIGGLLHSIGQKYSHSGIVTQPYSEVTHSTMSEERLSAKHVSGDVLDGVNGQALRYGWPGVVRQSAHAAFEGEKLKDPSGKEYRILGFGWKPMACGADDALVYPLVVSTLEDSGRANLELMAAHAKRWEGRGHYRFYAYSDGSISLDGRFNGPDNSSATVCSTFIWHLAQASELPLEGTLEPSDIAAGAQLRSATHDGLYFYPEAVRRTGAEHLFKSFRHMVHMKAAEEGLHGEIIAGLEDAADDVATQMLNCFAFDDCDKGAKDREGVWKSPGDGLTVSPDNILLWDQTYGYNEQTIYRETAFRPVYKWAMSKGKGDLWVTVNDADGRRVKGARVALSESRPGAPVKMHVATAKDGMVKFLGMSQGRHAVRASAWIDGQYLDEKGIGVVPDGATGRLTLKLPRPMPDFRDVSVAGTIKIKDDEWFGRDVTLTHYVNETFPRVTKGTSVTREFDKCVGDEVVAYWRITVTGQAAGRVRVGISARLAEGTSCRTKDWETPWRHWSGYPTPSSSPRFTTDLKSSGGDYAKFDLKVYSRTSNTVN